MTGLTFFSTTLIPTFTLALAFSSPVLAQSILCEDGICRAAIEETRYFDRPAYQVTDGRSEIVVVPEIGRIMRYGRVGGKNLLWNAPTSKGIDRGWVNYGGDKTWLGPQSNWKMRHHSKGEGWPPDLAFDGQPHEIEVITGGKLKMTSPLSPINGIRLSRTLYFDDNGDLVIEQTATKEKGAPVRASIWSVTQAIYGQAFYLRTNPQSPYQNGYYSLQGSNATSQNVTLLPSGLLKIEPDDAKSLKIGVDSPVASIVSVVDGVAFQQKAPLVAGQYPDGAQGAGFPVELFTTGHPKIPYAEMQLLSPLRDFWVGSKWTQTVRWSLHDLKGQDVDEAVAKLMQL